MANKSGEMNWYSYLFYLFSATFAVPFSIAVIWRFLHPHHLETHAIKVPPNTALDNFYRVMLVPYVFYYILDSSVLLYLYEAMDECNLAFLLHHVVSLFGLPVLFKMPYYPWFAIAPIAFHCYLIWFPAAVWLNYIYLSFILYMYYGLLQKPWVKHRVYQIYFGTGITILVVPIFMLWLFSCSNAMENTRIEIA